MNSRESILESIREADVPQVERPAPFIVSSSPGSLDKFIEMVTAVGGSVDRLPQGQSIKDYLESHSVYKPILEDRNSVIFRSRDISNLELNELEETDSTSPKEFTLSLLSGEFGVSENGAVWVRPLSLRARLALFSTEHLVLTMTEIVLPTMHEAYARIEIASDVSGYFISGPSKTADIEQNLVIGAQGARSLLVLLNQNSGLK